MKDISTKIYTIHDKITQIAAIMAAVGLSFIVIFYVYEVVTRYFFNSPTAWVSDFVSYALCASVFLALPEVTRTKSHVAVTIVVDLIPKNIAGYVHFLINIIGFCCLIFAAYVSLQENIRQFSKGIETLAIIPVPQWWISSFITFGLAASALYMLRHAPPSQRDHDDTVEGTD